MDLFDMIANNEEESFTDSKKDVLKFLKIIGVDSRFVSYTPSKLYINNLRFSKFSRKREKTFYHQYPQIKVVRSTLFQKICSKSSKILANIKPNSKILISDEDNSLNKLVEIILEPYTRKYGVKLVYSGDYDYVVNPLIQDDEVNEIFASLFKGEGINFNKKDSELYPLRNIEKKWVNNFLENEGFETLKNKNEKDEYVQLANSFMEFLADVAPQFRDNVLRASDYIEENLKVKE
ncbi:MAG: ATPase [Methanobrevibacter woesei]|uniref:ATPase n=1 Tax=Methanobrevibacter woesei TaxID=190976 RepID=UPI001F9913A5|nr:ATPase [Methanobrevibacter woesei]MCC9262326.1 ATPase [Methanobrevibacter woesei]